MTIMTVGELKARLDDYDDDAEVRVALQPSWPLQVLLAGVAARSELPSTDELAEGATDDDEHETCWLVASDRHPDDTPYAPRALWDEV